MMNDSEINAIVNSSAIIVSKIDEELAVKLLDALKQLMDDNICMHNRLVRYECAIRNAWEIINEGVERND